MEQRLKAVLEEAFPGIDVQIEKLSEGRLIGSVVWAGFAGMDDVARQERIRSLLRERLGAEATLVGVLLAYTPEELKTMRAA